MTKAKVWSQEEIVSFRADAVEKDAQGKWVHTYPGLGKKYGISESAVYRQLKKHGMVRKNLETPKHVVVHRRPPTVAIILTDEAAASLQADARAKNDKGHWEYSYEALARRHNLSSTAIYRFMKKWGMSRLRIAENDNQPAVSISTNVVCVPELPTQLEKPNQQTTIVKSLWPAIRRLWSIRDECGNHRSIEEIAARLRLRADDIAECLRQMGLGPNPYHNPVVSLPPLPLGACTLPLLVSLQSDDYGEVADGNAGQDTDYRADGLNYG